MVADEADIPHNCGGTLRAPVRGDDSHKGCPSKDRLVVAVGWPRHGDAIAPANAAPDSSRWTFRVLVSAIGPAGYNVQASDYVLAHSGARWRFVGKKMAGWVE
jgi:hypothetical protein